MDINTILNYIDEEINDSKSIIKKILPKRFKKELTYTYKDIKSFENQISIENLSYIIWEYSRIDSLNKVKTKVEEDELYSDFYHKQLIQQLS